MHIEIVIVWLQEQHSYNSVKGLHWDHHYSVVNISYIALQSEETPTLTRFMNPAT